MRTCGNHPHAEQAVRVQQARDKAAGGTLGSEVIHFVPAYQCDHCR